MATLVTAQPRQAVAPSGVWSWITTVDHKRIGILYGASALLFFLLGGIEALIMRLQLGGPNAGVVSADVYNQLFTMHGTTMIFLALMPAGSAFFNFIVPLQIGARDVAFPRLNAFSFWVFLFGGLFLNLSWLFGGAPDGGWFGYAPLTTNSIGGPFSVGTRIDFWVLGLQIVGIASLAASVNFIVTIINLRAPGMTPMRMPPFTWMTLVTSFLLIFAIPVITVALILLLFDRFFGTHIYIPAGGGDPILWQHLFWMFGHPEVYILILPAMGVISEVLPTFSRKPLFGYQFVVYSGIAIAFLGFAVWAHHMFSVGMGPVADSAFSVATMLIAIPTGVKIFNWLGTLWQGSLNFKTPLYFGVGFIGMFIIGGLSGVMHASPPADLQQTDTYFVVAHFHYVLFGGTVFGLFAGTYYWWPKITGRLLDETLGKWHFWLMLVGFNLTFFPQHFLGLNGMPRRVYTYPAGLGWEFWNGVSTLGAFLIAVSILIFLVNVFKTARSGQVAGNDPWDAATLEWTIPSPPPEYNFARLPRVRSRRPFWDAKHGAGHGEATEPAAVRQAQAAVAVAEHQEPVPTARQLGIHMPNPSFFPALLAAGLTLLAVGMLTSFIITGVGVLVLLVAVFGWVFEPAG